MLCPMGNGRPENLERTGRATGLAEARIGHLLDVHSPVSSALHDDDRLLDRGDDLAAAADRACREAGSGSALVLVGTPSNTSA